MPIKASVPYARRVDVPGYALRMRRRWVERGLPDYPMWIAGVIDSAALATAAVVVGQRGADALPVTVCLVLVALVPWVLELWGHPSATWPWFALLTGGSVVALSTAYPLDYDFAPFLLVLSVGHVTGCAGVRPALAVLAAGLAIVVGLSVAGTLPASAAVIWAAAMVVPGARARCPRAAGGPRGTAADRAGGPRRRGALAQRDDAPPHRRAP
jgi:hypothetical protein